MNSRKEVEYIVISNCPVYKGAVPPIRNLPKAVVYLYQCFQCFRLFFMNSDGSSHCVGQPVSYVKGEMQQIRSYLERGATDELCSLDTYIKSLEVKGLIE